MRSDTANGLDDLGGVGKIAVFGVETGEIEDDFFGVGIDVAGRLELLFGFFVLMLYGVELAEHHAVFHALGIERDDLLKFGDGLIERVAVGRRGGNGVLRFAQLAQIEAAKQTMRVDVVG